jgi:ligand-binding sensor domain-containing protein
MPGIRVIQRYTTANGLPSNRISCIYVDDHDAWVGTDDGGVARLNFAEGNWLVTKAEDGLASNRVTGIIGYQGRLYVGTQDGISIWDGISWTTEREVPPVKLSNAVFRVQEGTLWVAARTMKGGLVTFDGKAWKNRSTLEQGTLLNNIADFTFGGKTLWVGTTNRGVLRFDQEGVRSFMTADGLATNFVYTLAVRGDEVYVGGCCGVSALQGGEWRVYEVPQGLPHATVNAIVPDGGLLWFGTAKGLALFDGADFVKVKEAPELREARISSIFVHGDEVWVGTDTGLTRLEKAY